MQKRAPAVKPDRFSSFREPFPPAGGAAQVRPWL